MAGTKITPKSWPDLDEEEESKEANVEIMMQPQDHENQIEESKKQAKINKITQVS